MNLQSKGDRDTEQEMVKTSIMQRDMCLTKWVMFEWEWSKLLIFHGQSQQFENQPDNKERYIAGHHKQQSVAMYQALTGQGECEGKSF